MEKGGSGGGKIWMGNSITFNVFFIETFPKALFVVFFIMSNSEIEGLIIVVLP